VDASEHFSSRILPYVRRLIFPSRGVDAVGEIDETIHRAMIVRQGELTERHRWLTPAVQALRDSPREGSKTKAQSRKDLRPNKRKILLLGSGLVARPSVDVFAARTDVQLAICTPASQMPLARST
jgi:alpha-aminoadipic semialdehyde synthase